MKKLRKLCIIPLWGPIILFLIVNNKLKKIGYFDFKKAVFYLMLAALLGSLSMFLAMGMARFIGDFLWPIIVFFYLFVGLLMPWPIIIYSKTVDEYYDDNDYLK